MSRRPPADRARRWYQSNAGRYDRRHPGLPGDADFYAALARDARVLEVGAGTGRITAALAGVARLVVAVDNAPAMLALAGRRLAGAGNVRLLGADARALPLVGRFDLAVLAYRVLQHLDAGDRAAFLLALRGLLAPGGRLAFDTWHGPAPRECRASGADVRLHPVSVLRLARELRNAGFEIARLARTFSGQHEQDRSFTRVWLAVASA